MSSIVKIFAGLGALALTACAVAEMPEPAEGFALYQENCALCHGPSGRGDGEIAAGMRPKPSDLTRITQRHKSFPRAHVLSVIDGYSRMDIPGQEMPEFGLLLRGPTVPIEITDGNLSPVPRPLAALLTYLESIQR